MVQSNDRIRVAAKNNKSRTLLYWYYVKKTKLPRMVRRV